MSALYPSLEDLKVDQTIQVSHQAHVSLPDGPSGLPRVTKVGLSYKLVGVEGPMHASHHRRACWWSRCPGSRQWNGKDQIATDRPLSDLFCSSASSTPHCRAGFLWCLACSAPRSPFLPPSHLPSRWVWRIWDFSMENLVGNWAPMFWLPQLANRS